MIDRSDVLSWLANPSCKSQTTSTDQDTVEAACQCLQQGTADLLWLQLWALSDLQEARYAHFLQLHMLHKNALPEGYAHLCNCTSCKERHPHQFSARCCAVCLSRVHLTESQHSAHKCLFTLKAILDNCHITPAAYQS